MPQTAAGAIRDKRAKDLPGTSDLQQKRLLPPGIKRLFRKYGTLIPWDESLALTWYHPHSRHPRGCRLMKSMDGTSPLSPGCAAALRHAKNAHGRSNAEPRGPCSGGRYAGLHLTRLSGNNAQSVLILSSAVPVFIKPYVLGATLSKLYPIPMRRVKRGRRQRQIQPKRMAK